MRSGLPRGETFTVPRRQQALFITWDAEQLVVCMSRNKPFQRLLKTSGTCEGLDHPRAQVIRCHDDIEIRPEGLASYSLIDLDVGSEFLCTSVSEFQSLCQRGGSRSADAQEVPGVPCSRLSGFQAACALVRVASPWTWTWWALESGRTCSSMKTAKRMSRDCWISSGVRASFVVKLGIAVL